MDKFMSNIKKEDNVVISTAKINGRLISSFIRTTLPLLVAALLLLLCSNPLAAQNAPDTVTIKLPYDGPEMRFKAVHLGISEKNFFASKKITLGSREGSQSYKERLVDTMLSGSFIGKRKNGKSDWLYYLGETEVSRGQWNSIMRWMNRQKGKSLSAQGSDNPLLPQTGATVAEIYRFIEGLNTWMLQEQSSRLPKLYNAKAFCRLPTEAEWAFAARGGIEVNKNVFDRPHPYSEDLGKHEWHKGNSSGTMRKCGSIELANPVGLKDMLGNVEELTVSLFSPEYQQGRFGQFVIRGNNYSDFSGDFNVAHRTEFASHDQQGKLRHPSKVGFRLALSTSIASTGKLGRELDKEFDNYVSSLALPKPGLTGHSSPAQQAEDNCREYSKREADRFKTDIEDKKSEISRLLRLRNKDQVALSEKEQNNLELQNRKKELEAQIHDLQKQLKARPTPDVAKALQQKLRQAEVEKQGLREDLVRLKKIAIDSGPLPFFENESEVSKQRQQIKDLKQQIAVLPSLKEWEKLQQDFDKLQKENQASELNLSKKQVKERFFIDEGNRKQQKIAELEQNLKQKQQTVEDLERRLSDSEKKIAENANFAKIAEKRYLEALMRQAYTNAYNAYEELVKRQVIYLPEKDSASQIQAEKAYSQACQYIHDYWQLVVKMAQTQPALFPEVKQDVSEWLRKGEKENLFSGECKTQDGQQFLSPIQRKSLGLIERHVRQVRNGRSRLPDDLIDSFIDQPEFQ
nr:SUMF1/EgtB/PvdO family nonheme iron enzyme [Candidatus Electrothrix aestuarii]